jgi:hypothetical protein
MTPQNTSSLTDINTGSIYSVRHSLRCTITLLTGFIVLFCNAIQEANSTDLKPLTDFVTSLESCRSVSEGAEKLYNMCLLFLKVARLYINAKSQEVKRTQEQPYIYSINTGNATSSDVGTTARFDPHLNALGLMPTSAWPTGSLSQGLRSQTQGSYASTQLFNDALGFDCAGVGYGPMSTNQSSIQDWFSGSRYLINSMEAGSDFRMPDIDDRQFE